MKKYIAYTLIPIACTLFAQESYTVDELVSQALHNAPDITISAKQIESSQSRYDSAFGEYLPRVDLVAGAGVAGMSDITQNNSVRDDKILLGKATLQQLIYDFGKTGGKSDSYKYETSAYTMQNVQNISNKIRSVKVAYYDLLHTYAIIDVNEENIKLNQAQLYRTQRYFQAGIRTKIDVSDAKVRLIQAKLDLRNAINAQEIAFAKLDKEIGYTKSTREYSVYKNKLDYTHLYETLSPYPLDLAESIEYAYKHRYVLKKIEEQIKVSQAQKDLASSNYYPALRLNADYTRQDAGKLPLPETQWQAMVNLSWNIYEGRSTAARNQESEINIQIAKLQLEQEKLVIKNEVTQAYLNLYNTKDSVQLSQSLLAVSQEKFEQATKRYEHGLSDYIELQEARQGYINAKASLVVDYYNYYKAIAVLDNAIGK